MRHCARRRDDRPPIDTGPLGKWSLVPDRAMQRSTRASNPLDPEYYIFGAPIIAPPGVGKARTCFMMHRFGIGLRRRRHAAPSANGPLGVACRPARRQSWTLRDGAGLSRQTRMRSR